METTGPKISGAGKAENPSFSADQGEAGAVREVQTDLSLTDQKLVDLDARLTSLQRRIEGLEAGVQELKALPARVNSEVDRLEKRFNTLR